MCLRVTGIFQGWLHRTLLGLQMLSLLLLWLDLTDSLTIRSTDVRLVDGNSFNEGRVEIYYDGQWGTICDDNWNMAAAQVVCRSLGFLGATEVKMSAAFGEGSGPILLDDVNCVGTETSLRECGSGGWFHNNCGHGEDAGVVCAKRIVYNPGIFVLDHAGNFSEDFGKLYDSQQDCDINITVMTAANNSESHGHVCAHSLILRTNSEARILLQQSNNSYTLLVEEECLLSVNSFLRYFYSRQIEITLDSVKCIHELASAYGVPGLQADCRQIFPYLLPLDPSFHGPLELYEHSLSSGDSNLQQLILQYLTWNCEDLSHTEAWLGLRSDHIEVLLSRTDLVIESEWSLLKALDRWAQANGRSEIVKGLLEKIRFPMFVPEQLFKLHFNLSLYEAYSDVFQRKIREALEFHTVPFNVFTQYSPQVLKSDAYVPRFYFASNRNMYLTYDVLTEYNGSSASQLSETPKHPSYLFNTQNVSWSFTYHDIAENCQKDHISSSDTFLSLHLEQTGSQDNTIWYENKALVVCQDSYIIDVLDFKNGTAVVPEANMLHFPCPTGYIGVMALVRPSYKLNA